MTDVPGTSPEHPIIWSPGRPATGSRRRPLDVPIQNFCMFVFPVKNSNRCVKQELLDLQGTSSRRRAPAGEAVQQQKYLFLTGPCTLQNAMDFRFNNVLHTFCEFTNYICFEFLKFLSITMLKSLLLSSVFSPRVASLFPTFLRVFGILFTK